MYNPYYAKLRKEASSKLGPITYYTEQLFSRLQCFFSYFPDRFIKWFGWPQERAIDAWLFFRIAIWLTLLIWRYSEWQLTIWKGTVWFLSLFVILNIFQIVVNVGLFNHLGQIKQAVAHVTRSIVLLVINYFELMLWFGLIYLSDYKCYLIPSNPQETVQWFDAFYFSVITQLTIGYGDIHPQNAIKAIAVAQGIVGWMMALLVLARFISAMPKITNSK